MLQVRDLASQSIHGLSLAEAVRGEIVFSDDLVGVIRAVLAKNLPNLDILARIITASLQGFLESGIVRVKIKANAQLPLLCFFGLLFGQERIERLPEAHLVL